MCAAAVRRRPAHALPIRPDSPSRPSRHTRIDMHMLCRSQCAYRHATEAHTPANTTSARAAWNTLAQLHQPCRCVARFECIAAVAKPSRRELLQVPRQLQKARCSRSSFAAAIDLAEERQVVHGRRQLPPYRYSTPCNARPAPTAPEPLLPFAATTPGKGDMRVKSLFHLDMSTMEGLLDRHDRRLIDRAPKVT